MFNPAVATPSSMPGTPYEGGDATMHTEDEMTKDKCCTCRKLVDPENSLVIVKASTKSSEVRRCRACHNVRSALNRLTPKHGNLVGDFFTKVDGDRLQAFYENHAHLRGEDLKSKVEEVVTDWRSSTTRVEFNTDGEYMDEVDLAQKYEKKPDMLKNILMMLLATFALSRNAPCILIPSTPHGFRMLLRMGLWKNERDRWL